MSGAWLREEQEELAASKILEAASRAFTDLGVSRTGMGDIARYAGCSRGTLYRYFKTRHALHLAYVNHMAVELAARVALDVESIADPRERLIEGVLRSIHEVRSRPDTAAWFTPGEAGVVASVTRGSEVIDAISAGFVGRLLTGERLADAKHTRRPSEEDELPARWLVRVIVSLLSMPGRDEEEEREMVRRFVAPAMVSG